MANTFKVVSHDVMPASAGTPEDLYTTPGSTTTVVLGLVLCNVHTAQVTLAVGQSTSVLMGAKIVLETTDKIQIDCSVADKLSVTMSIMEIT